MSATEPLLSNLDRHNAVATEYLGKLLECHEGGQSENDIRMAFRDFIIRTGIIDDEREIKSEIPPSSDSNKRVDMYTRNTYIEFKRNIITGGGVDAEYTRQLDQYLLASVKSGWGIENGILTDGKHYLKRNIGDDILPVTGNVMRVFDRPAQGHILRGYLNDIIDTEAQCIIPSADTLTKHLGLGSDLLKQATALLKTAHDEHRDEPTVAVKRKLWQDLLEVALGQDSAGDPNSADWLFIRHTYLTTLTALIIQARFGIDVVHEADHSPEQLLNGVTLNNATNLRGVIEADLFQWPSEIGSWQHIRSIARKVAQFDWTQRTDELTSILYQNTITPEERKRMGEYYTPRWLAQTIVDELIEQPESTVVMDPACGSGTFIESMAHNIITASTSDHPSDTLNTLQNNIIGIDLHPVAVQLAKATWVLSCHEIIGASRHSDRPTANIVPPIYLGDSLQLRYERNILTQSDHITLRTTEQLQGEIDTVHFQLPMSLARQNDRFDLLMLDLARAIDFGSNTDDVLDKHGIADDPERDTMRKTADQMRKLHAVDRNHVWAYYLRNMVRPAVIAEQRVDAVVGNPPWQSYSKSADIVREELQNLSQGTYNIWTGGNQAPNVNLATLFFSRIVDLYLNNGGKIGMVLPHSVLRSGQHIKWRGGYWQTQGTGNQNAVAVDFRCKIPWDLENLKPNCFFPVPSAVVFAQALGNSNEIEMHKRQAKALAPGRVEIWSGATGTPTVARASEPLHHDDGEFHSPYADIAMRGADIYDRRLYLVTEKPNTTFMAAPDTFFTYPRESNQDNKKYDVSILAGNIVHDDNLFNVYLAESIAPYVALAPLKAVLPVDKRSLMMPIDHSKCTKNAKTGSVKHDACQADVSKLDIRMQDRWPRMESLWDANKGKSDKKSLFQNLNYINKLTSQLEYLREPGDRPVRIAYVTTTNPIAAMIRDHKAILDTSTYQVACRDQTEAFYLLAILNSSVLHRVVAPIMSKGRISERNVHKHPWKLPISAFNPDDADHVQLASLGERASSETFAIVNRLEDATRDKARGAIRDQWQSVSNTARAIEAAVTKLLDA